MRGAVKHRLWRGIPEQEYGKAFREKSNSVLHMSTTHHKSRWHQYPHCPSDFLHQHSLKTHVESVHQKLRPHMCDLCGGSVVPSTSYIYTTTFRKICLFSTWNSMFRPRVSTKVSPQTASREAACEHLRFRKSDPRLFCRGRNFAFEQLLKLGANLPVWI